MFQNIRNRLLLSYLLILASVLGVFIIGIRLIFAHSLTEQISQKLTVLGQGASGNAEWENNHLKIDNDFRLQELLNKSQSLEWFDKQGNSILKQGKFVITIPFSQNILVQIQQGNPDIQSITLPIIDSDYGQLIGYVRVSQSLEELEETLTKLDWVLGISMIIALMGSGIGAIILTNQAMQPIEESFQRLKQFTADASHELRNPLMVIDSNVSVSLKYAEGMRKTDQESFEAIASATDQMINLTEDLLILARADRVNLLKKEKVNLVSILEQLIKLNHTKIKTKNLDLQLNFSENLFIFSDSLKLERLFSNLIDNAIYYTPKSGIIYIEGKLKKSSIEIEIKDTGIGIASENLEKIFERFWRADTSRSYWNGGSGLGLAIVQAIVHHHGGTITVSSQLGIGSCFIVSLPIN
ncbi:HAMP domain-containing sensor histidine kinase [Aphanothece sacrum]|uniref:histidine kinase n=1 Tax=Aphanothece sacrum FPU1 TaxID=1920663 RepID=A0A401INW2_APHSA|nr:HAMP domain-containing sensor histidine kinase [Aphanothece sacrum]GBF82939.1 two-component sensor histidine kinase [Aphanothece sacrum FPU1]GBF86915.1 two-component sensor histidine kinase [Aphanothece sacrum FPU3]